MKYWFVLIIVLMDIIYENGNLKYVPHNYIILQQCDITYLGYYFMDESFPMTIR